MRGWQSQSHVRWYCRYHVVIVPKYRHKAIFGVLRKDSVGMSIQTRLISVTVLASDNTY
jgi:REP element-mobilizing transposase RayT